jgi:hypothetical protein
MGESSESPLVRLSRSKLASEDPLGDVRGRMVAAPDDEFFGTVAVQLIDRREKTTRFLEIVAVSLDELTQQTILAPVQAIERVDEHRVYLGHAREVIASAPTYNPHVEPTAPYLHELYEHFGCPPPGEAGIETPS